MFGAGRDDTAVRVSVTVTFVLGLVTLALLLADHYFVPREEGANIGLGGFMLLVALPGAFWACRTFAATLRTAVPVRWRILSLVSVLLLTTPWIVTIGVLIVRLLGMISNSP